MLSQIEEPGFKVVSDSPCVLRCYTHKALAQSDDAITPCASPRNYVRTYNSDALPFSGSQEVIFFDDDFGLILIDYVIRDSFDYEFIYESLGFVQFQITDVFQSRRGGGRELPPGYTVRLAPEGFVENLSYSGATRLRTVTPFFTSATIANILAPDVDRAGQVMDGLTAWSEQHRRDPQPLTPGMLETIRDTIACPFEGGLRRSYLEAKTTELLCLTIAGFLDSGPADDDLRLSRNDVEKLNEARAILDRDFIAPPTLMALGRQVGLNRKKLTTGFKALFSETIYQYSLKRRMEHARSLLGVGEMRIAEIAEVTGYADQASFSRAFRQFHGEAPSHYVSHGRTTPGGRRHFNG